MDDLFAWLQSKIGPVSYGAVLGFILQVIVFRPSNWGLAAERAVAAIALPFLFAKPFIPVFEKYLGMDTENATVVVSGIAALAGVELVRAIRNAVLKRANTIGGPDE